MERILLVEPNGAIAESLAGVLSEAGYDVTVASRVAEAQSILRQNRADL
jgi:DNA-binding response OmpR family regulator